jgi:hypothetical protein
MLVWSAFLTSTPLQRRNSAASGEAFLDGLAAKYASKPKKVLGALCKFVRPVN